MNRRIQSAYTDILTLIIIYAINISANDSIESNVRKKKKQSVDFAFFGLL